MVYERGTVNLGALLRRTEVDVYLRAGSAGACVAHLPEVVVLVAVDDVGCGQMLLPIGRGFVVTGKAFLGRAFKHCGIETVGVKTEHVYEIFPRPVDGFFLEIVAKAPVAEHLEHGVVIGVHAHFL